MRRLLLLTAVILLYGMAFAQTPLICATDSIWQADSNYQLQSDAFAAELAEFRAKTPASSGYTYYGNTINSVTAGCDSAVYIIPIVVHIDTSGGTVNVTDTQVYQQIKILNDRFAPYQIRFVLAKKRPNGTSFTGINRFGGTFNYRYGSLATSYSSSPTHYYDPEKYFNIYVAPKIYRNNGLNSPSTITGFNQRFADSYPLGPDLVVVQYKSFGDYNTCTNCDSLKIDSWGLVLVHEAGHFLGLRELFQGGCGEANNAASCAIKGDLCCDTRPVDPNYSCPVPTGNDCSYHLNIADNHENYMDYSGQACQTNFTADQVSLMRATLELYRNKLVSPQNLNTLDLTDCFASAWFDAKTNFLCDSGDFTLHAIQYTGAIGYRWIIDDGINNLVDTTLAVDSFTWRSTTVGTYNVILQIIYGTNDTAFVTRFNYLQIADCGNTIASEQGNWYFGDHAGLRFTNGGAIRDKEPSARFPFNISTSEGTISQSNSNGQLLFYAGGKYSNPGYMEVYDSNYVQMPNSPIIGDFSAVQAGAVVQNPTDTNQYYLFTVAASDAFGNKGFRYSIIDMTLNGGLGDIDTTAKNVPVKGPAGTEPSPLDSSMIVSEQITVIPKCEHDEYWILVVNGFDANTSTGLYIHVYELSKSGVSYHGKMNTPITTDTNAKTIITQLKASPDGNWLFVYGKLIRFNKLNGTMQLYRTVTDRPLFSRPNSGASFSPNSQFLYVLEQPIAQLPTTEIYQYDLTSGDKLTLDRTKVTDYPFSNADLQLGPDGKIYIAKYNQTSLAVIHYPDSNINLFQPNKCGYSYNGPVLKSNGEGGTSIYGLPNMVDAKLAGDIPLDFLIADSNCHTIKCFVSTPCMNSYHWDFGDGDTSTQKEPIHTYADTGLYTITLTVNGTIVKQKEKLIGIRSRIVGDTIACLINGNNTVQYSIANRDDDVEYVWSVANGSPTFDSLSGNISITWLDSSLGALNLSGGKGSSGCTFVQHMLVHLNYLDSNRIWPDTGMCFSGQPLHILGNIGQASLSPVSYEWQYSKDGLTWDTIGTADTLQDLSGIIQDTILYYRRVVKSGECKFVSNYVRISPVVVKKHPQSVAFCPGDPNTFNFPIELWYEPSITVTLEKHHYSASTGTWSVGSAVNYPDTFPTAVGNGDSIKIKIIRNGCGYVFSNTAFAKWPKPSVYGLHTEVPCTTIVVSSVPANLPYGSDTFVYVTIVDTLLDWLHGVSNADAFFEWERNIADAGWEPVPNSNNDTLFFTADDCTAGEYRVKVRVVNLYNSSCIYVQHCNWNYRTVSLNTDLWSRDGIGDIGDEPNTPNANDYWGSPDLWNCWINPNCNTHENPEYMASNWNVLRTNVRNKGAGASGPFTVKTYWTIGGFYEQWPLSWHYDTVNNGYYNSNDHKTYPMGAEIGALSYPGLSSGSAQQFAFLWAPPYPGWYNTTKYFNAGRLSHPLCVLSRIITCPDPYYGMRYEEIVPTGVNVINNNNIVTRNTEVYDSIGFNKTTPEWVLRIGNQWAEPKRIRFGIDNSVNNFWDLGYLMVQFEPEIYEAWTDGGSVGSGYTLIDSVFYVDSNGFYLDNIDLDSNQWGWAHFQFRLNEETEITENRGQQLFQLVQLTYDDSLSVYNPDGGFNFLLNLLPPPPPHVDSLEFVISPNPTFPGFVAVTINSNFSTTGVTLNVYDGLGIPVIPTHNISNLSSGGQIETVDLSSVASGVYFMVITANGNNYNEIVVVQ